MTGFIPNEAIAARVTFAQLGVEFLPAPPQPEPPTAPPIPAVYHAIAQRINEFEYANERVLCWMLWSIQRSLKPDTHPAFIDKRDPDALIAEAVHSCRRLMSQQTTDEGDELARWIDFLPDAYAIREEWHAAWDDQRARRLASARRGAETRKRNREQREAAKR